MKKEINKVNQALEECFNSYEIEEFDNKINLLEKSVRELFNICINDRDFFATFLNNSILKPIANQMDTLWESLFPLSSPFVAHRKLEYKILESLKVVRVNFFKDYHRYLKGFSEYDSYIEESSKARTYKRDYLLSTGIDASLEFNSEQYFKKIVERASDNTFRYFKDGFEGSKDIEKSKQELLIFVKELVETKDKLKEMSLKKEDELELFKKTEAPNGFEDYELKDGDIVTVNLLEEYGHELAGISDSITNFKNQQTVLGKLSEKLYDSFLFLQDFKPSKESPTTVFHSLKFEELNSFCEELREFIGMQVKLETIKEVFTVGYPIDNPKINLINGTLNDFGFLISEMRRYFIDSIKTKSNYAQWWSERFTFNLIEKDKKNVSNMISNMEKGTRFPSKKQSIFKIIESLNPIPQ